MSVAELPHFHITPEDLAIWLRVERRGTVRAVASVVADLQDAHVMERIEARREHAWRVDGAVMTPADSIACETELLQNVSANCELLEHERCRGCACECHQ